MNEKCTEVNEHHLILNRDIICSIINKAKIWLRMVKITYTHTHIFIFLFFRNIFARMHFMCEIITGKLNLNLFIFVNVFKIRLKSEFKRKLSDQLWIRNLQRNVDNITLCTPFLTIALPPSFYPCFTFPLRGETFVFSFFFYISNESSTANDANNYDMVNSQCVSCI